MNDQEKIIDIELQKKEDKKRKIKKGIIIGAISAAVIGLAVGLYFPISNLVQKQKEDDYWNHPSIKIDSDDFEITNYTPTKKNQDLTILFQTKESVYELKKHSSKNFVQIGNKSYEIDGDKIKLSKSDDETKPNLWSLYINGEFIQENKILIHFEFIKKIAGVVETGQFAIKESSQHSSNQEYYVSITDFGWMIDQKPIYIIPKINSLTFTPVQFQLKIYDKTGASKIIDTFDDLVFEGEIFGMKTKENFNVSQLSIIEVSFFVAETNPFDIILKTQII